jgi:predicted nucleotidyltransferase
MAVTSQFLSFIPKFAAWADSKPAVRRAWAYGSRLRGTQREDSDLDLALEIETSGSEDEAWNEWMAESDDWKAELEELSQLNVQLEWYAGEATPRILRFTSCCSMLVFERPNKSLERTRER